MNGLLRLERYFARQRLVRPDVLGAFDKAMRLCRAQDPGAGTPVAAGRLRRAGRLMAHALDRRARQARDQGELAYHNRHHAAEAVLSMGLLCAASRRLGRIGALDAAVGVAAMVGHDLGHDGSASQDGRLERQAAAAVDRLAMLARVPVAQRRQLREVIEATMPSRIRQNAAQALGPQPPGRSGRTMAELRLLANEADITASLMPRLGRTLGRALAEEGRVAGVPGAAALATHSGRLAFLLSMPRFSAAARQLGLARLRDDQVSTYLRTGRRLGLDAQGAAAELDRDSLEFGADDAFARRGAGRASQATSPNTPPGDRRAIA